MAHAKNSSTHGSAFPTVTPTSFCTANDATNPQNSRCNTTLDVPFASKNPRRSKASGTSYENVWRASEDLASASCCDLETRDVVPPATVVDVASMVFSVAEPLGLASGEG